MASGKFWYYVGASVGVLVRIFVLLLCIGGFIYQVWNREIPFLPVLLFLVYQMWAKMFVVYEAVIFIASNPPKETLSPTEIEKLINLINFKNTQGGGPN